MKIFRFALISALLTSYCFAECTYRDFHSDGTYELFCGNLINLGNGQIRIENLKTKIRDDLYANKRFNIHPLQSKKKICKVFGEAHGERWCFKRGTAKLERSYGPRASLNGNTFSYGTSLKRRYLSEITCKKIID